MPRIEDRSTPAPYVPGPPPAAGTTPEQITRAVWDELQRLSQYLASLELPAPANVVTRRSRRP